MTIEKQRKLIHDIANNLSVVDSNLVIVIRALTKNNPHLSVEIDRLMKATENSSHAINSLRELRTIISENPTPEMN